MPRIVIGILVLLNAKKSSRKVLLLLLHAKKKMVPAVTSSAIVSFPSRIPVVHPYASLFAPEWKPLSPIMSQVFEENVSLSQQESLTDSISVMHSDTIIHPVYANSDSSKKSEYENMPSFSQKHDFTGYDSDIFG